MVTIKEVLASASDILKMSGTETGILDAQLILCDLLGHDRVYLLTHPEKELGSDTENEYFNKINLSANGMPTQYIIGYQEFMSLKFIVDNNVLIPRNDTEVLVEQIIKNVDKNNFCNIFEIGVGSGCISISLAKYIEKCEVVGIDISKDALNIAKQNAKLHGVEEKVKFSEENIFTPLENYTTKFDIIVSNPPYIPTKTINMLNINVKDYEPRLALDGGEDGLDFYRRIIAESKKILKKNGYLYFEIGCDQGNKVKELLRNSQFVDINIVKDLAGLDRVIYGVNSN